MAVRGGPGRYVPRNRTGEIVSCSPPAARGPELAAGAPDAVGTAPDLATSTAGMLMMDATAQLQQLPGGLGANPEVSAGLLSVPTNSPVPSRYMRSMHVNGGVVPVGDTGTVLPPAISSGGGMLMMGAGPSATRKSAASSMSGTGVSAAGAKLLKAVRTRFPNRFPPLGILFFFYLFLLYMYYQQRPPKVTHSSASFLKGGLETANFSRFSSYGSGEGDRAKSEDLALAKVAPPMLTRKQVRALSDDEFNAYLKSRSNPGKDSDQYIAQLMMDGTVKRMVMAKRLRATYCPLPRTGSLTWKLLFRKFSGVSNWMSVDTIWNPETSGLRSPFNLPHMELLEWLHHPKHFAFLFARNPYTKLLSFYIDKIEKGDPSSIEYQSYIDAWAGKGANVRWTTPPSFDEFVRGLYRRKRNLSFMNDFWLTQTRLCALPGFKYDFIARFENWDGDVAAVLRRLGMEKEQLPSVAEIFQTPTDADLVTSNYYDKQLRDMVYEILEPDFRILGYKGDSIAIKTTVKNAI
ncbi:Carbohydrate sulfotransferase 14 [Porphyridium purpureum]|uniref:Carbohydrate sulfotransferase 14 n=1 Tax=Porphyridium purpureum TaxID=35688 RepID=A0A5J4ZB11_PORPP|nr:Carbohydrate sulfotransferase 14 [Porphyridium purpureum]|eukprot:POR3010..scf295_1